MCKLKNEIALTLEICQMKGERAKNKKIVKTFN